MLKLKSQRALEKTANYHIGDFVFLVPAVRPQPRTLAPPRASPRPIAGATALDWLLAQPPPPPPPPNVRNIVTSGGDELSTPPLPPPPRRRTHVSALEQLIHHDDDRISDRLLSRRRDCGR